jgi:PAS domain S-box-containing protein
MSNSNGGNWQSILQANTAGFYLLNREYKVLLFNNAAVLLFKKITGRELYEGLDFVSVAVAERKNFVRETIDAAFLGAVTEYEIQYAGQEAGWVKARYSPAFDTHNNCTGVCVALEDITTRKELEEEARQRDLKFRGVFNFSGTGMVLVSPEGKLIDVNPALEKLFGYSREELLRATYQQITHPEDAGRELGYLQRMVAGELETYQIEKRYHHKNGSLVWAMVTVSIVRRPDGSPDFFIGQVADVTQVKAMINELNAKNQTLDFAAHDLEQKIQQLEEFTQMAAHNLRGPVGNISLITDMLKDAAPEDWPVWLDKLQQITESLLTTLTDLLAYTQVKLEAGIGYDECDIRAMCTEVLAQVAGTTRPGEVAMHYILEFTVISYPKVYLQSILYNLMSNAVKYRKADVPLSITIKTGMADDRRRLSICDNGTGFDMEKNKDKIFKLNSTFHKGFNSKGIGLFITKAQVEKLGGIITVESKPGEGATFSIVF